MKKIIKISLLKKESKLEELIRNNYFNKIKQKDGYKILLNDSYTQIANKLIDRLCDEIKKITIIKNSLLILKNINLNKEKRILIISIGDNRKYINSSQLEKNFGIKTIINFALKNKNKLDIKEITSKNKTTGDNLKEGKSIFTDNLWNFAFKTKTDVLKIIKIKEKFKDTDIIFTLNDWISMPIDENKNKKDFFKDIENLIEQNYNNNLYENKFKFIDFYIDVDEKLSEELTKKMFEEIKKNTKNIDWLFTWPEFEKDPHEYFNIGDNNEQLFILNKEKILQIANKQKRKLENIEIHSKSSEFGNLESFPIRKCIFFEYTYKSKQYIFNDGEWTEIEKNFLKNTDTEYKKLSNSLFKENFIDWKDNWTEKQYNENIADKKDWKCIDRKMIYLDQNSKLEIGDLLIHNKQTIVAVKNIHNSHNMSHLTQQVQHSISILKNDDKIKENLEKTFDTKDVNAIRKTKTFVVALGSKEKLDNNLPKIPFFAKLSLIELIKNPPFGLEIKIARIKKI